MEKESLYMDDFENVYEKDFDPEPEEISNEIISEIFEKQERKNIKFVL